MTNLTYSRQKIEMVNGKKYSLSNAKMSKGGMKKNHAIMASVTGKEYIVNIDNGFAYEMQN